MMIFACVLPMCNELLRLKLCFKALDDQWAYNYDNRAPE